MTEAMLNRCAWEFPKASGVLGEASALAEDAPHTVGGFPRHNSAAASLPSVERGKILLIARQIRSSFRPRQRRVRGVRLIGHADRDPRRGLAFERKISGERALSVQNALIAAIAIPGLVRRITWERVAVGAAQPMVPNARSEAERQRNRRVEIVVLTKAARPVAGSRRSYLRVRGQRFVGKVAPRPDRSASVAFDKTRAAFRPVGVGHLQLSSVNLREDVLNAMDRLHVLWSISNTDYAREYPTVSGLPLASIVDVHRLPQTVAAIVRNQEPTLHHLVARNFLHRPFSQPIGRNMPNVRDDVVMLQTSLRALGLLSDLDFARERAAIASMTVVTSANATIPKTLTALTELKEAIAGSRLGWAPLQADESEAGGDRFCGRTFDFEVTTLCSEPGLGGPRPLSHSVSIFIPRGAVAGVNKVHVFFSPRGAAGDRGDNDVLIQGLRGASDATDWILIGVSGIVNGWRTINSVTISACLARAGRPAGIEAVRLSGHSRGVSGLRETIARRLISAQLERVVVLDAPELLPGGAPGAARTIVYRVNVQGKSVRGAVHHDLDPGCMRVIGYTRLIRNAMVTNPYLTIPPRISAQLLPIPDRGCLTTTPVFNLRACQVNLGAFCNGNRAAVRAILRQESGPDGLHTFVETHNLLQAGHRVSPSIYSHHVFVAEIAHEITRP